MLYRIAVLITCHNRREKTLSSLSALFHADLLKNYSLDIFLVDDGSTDGTSIAVQNNFPSVNIIKGDGNLFWNGGMHLSWTTAKNKNDFDFYLWLNDDTIILTDALTNAILSSEEKGNASIICGATMSADFKCTYSAFRRISKHKFEKIEPNGKLQKCEVFNGNFVLIPQKVFHQVGNLDSSFTHFLGDFDYGLRASKLNISSYMLSDYIGYCEAGSSYRNWKNPNIKAIERIKLLYSPLGNNPLQFFKYQLRHFGLLSAIKYFISEHYKTIFIIKKNNEET